MSNLLYFAIMFLAVAVIAALFGFGSVVGIAMGGARMLFWVAITLFIVSAAAGVIRRV